VDLMGPKNLPLGRNPQERAGVRNVITGGSEDWLSCAGSHPHDVVALGAHPRCPFSSGLRSTFQTAPQDWHMK